MYAEDKESESSKESDESYASIPGLFQPADRSNKERDNVPNMVPREEISDEEK